jgi:YYY domain-containing protein
MMNQIQYFIFWYIFISIFGLFATPIVRRLFRSLPDRGYSVAKIVGVLIVAFLHWLLTSIGFTHNTVAGIWTAILLAAGITAWVSGKSGLQETLAWIKDHQNIVFVIEGLFLISFALMAVIRSYNPAVWGTEKPMELMFINSILASDTFPPQDAWLSGYGISYYYFGYVMVAMFAKLTATSGSIAFNLGIAMAFSLACLAVFGVVLNLIAYQKNKVELKEEKQSVKQAVIPALLAPVLLLVVGNFYGILQVFNQHHWFSNLQIPSVWFDASAIDAAAPETQVSAIHMGSKSFWEWLDIKQLNQTGGDSQPITSLDQPNWFFASRAIQDRDLSGSTWELIDEFPAFSFLLSDLHPHVLALPFVILCILLAFEWFVDHKQEKEAWESRVWLSKERVFRVVFSALILGSLIFLNTWDYPIYAFVFVLAVFMQNFPLSAEFHWKDLRGQFLKEILPLLVISILFYLPFLLSLQTQAGGILPNVIFPSRFRQVFVMFGPLMIPVSAFVIAYLIKHKKSFDLKFGGRFALALLFGLLLLVVILVSVIMLIPQGSNAVMNMIYPFSWNAALKLILQRRLLQSTTLVYALLLIFLTTAFLWASRTRNKNSSLFSFLLIFTGGLLLLGPELVYLQDQFGNRMNTVFKFYFQIWVLWSIASSYAIWYIFSRARGGIRWVWAGGMGLVLGIGLIYTVGTLNVTTSNFSAGPNLDGMAYFYQNYPQDAAAIDWINENVPKDAVILEGTRGAYWVDGRSSRFSMATGIPTVMGWVNHEGQWRGDGFRLVMNREGDIERIYTSRDWTVIEPLLEQYKVDYLIVSAEESLWYGTIDLQVFDQNLTRVFESGDLVIYQR